jgi:transcriptional regulator
MGRIEIPPGTLYMLILRSLDTLGPMHGYGIALHIERMSASVLAVEEGSLYPALQRMLIKGWVKAEWGVSENNRRARYYRLTSAGRRQLAEEVSQFQRVMEAIARVIEPASEAVRST